MATISELANWILEHDDIAIVPHVSPDGDALGSAMSLSHALDGLGKRNVVISEDPIPAMYEFLPGLNKVVQPGAVPFGPQGILFEDVAAYERAGDYGQLSKRVSDWAIIDHHETNAGFAPVSVIDANASATGVIVVRLLDELGIQIDELHALYLYTAISTDTGNFSYPNTTPESMEMAARLIETGFDLADTNYRLFRMRSVARTKLLGYALSAMQLADNGRVAYTCIPQSMFDCCGAEYAETEGIVNILAEMTGVEVAMTIEAREGGKSTKVSLRSNGDLDVSAIANTFQGGGHKNAAGMSIYVEATLAVDRALSAVLEALKSHQ